MTKRIAVKASGGNCVNADLVTLKLSPQIRHTTSMPRSALCEDEEDGTDGREREVRETEVPVPDLVTPEQ